MEEDDDTTQHQMLPHGMWLKGKTLQSKKGIMLVKSKT